MKFRGPFFFSVFVLAFLFGAAYYPSPDSPSNKNKEAILMHTILGGLNQLHYSPKAIDDEFSAKVFDLYIERLDGNRRWLTAQEVQQLKVYKSQLDDEANEGTYEFFDLSLDLLKNGIEKTQKYYQEILAQPFDYTVDEKVELDGEKKPFAQNDKELYEYWRKAMKYETMIRLANKIGEQEEESTEEKKSFEELEKEARQAVLEIFDDWYKRIKKRRRSDYMSSYLNAVTNIFDPHSGYYEPKDKENFDIGMSGTLEGIGARLQTDGDYTKVVHIVPGGPAWKHKELEENDLIMKVSQGAENAVDVTGFLIDDVVKLIRGKKGTPVTLTVKRVDGTIEDITIIRDVVILEEGYAKSVILDVPGKIENVGYINLPRFYADFSHRGGPSCAKDIGKELEKLKAENVNGIILDLRNNGGGSLRDVVKMSGLFIEEGPIVQVKSRARKAEILEDNDPRVQYGGPLIVMVNSFSASASEILAAALQDYGRAVIVGSNSTFGKGTVQRFFDLDRAIRGNNEVKPLGEVKMTIQKFYRVNGGSTQLKGVVPDIVLPDRYHLFKTGEQEQEFALAWTEIAPVDFEQDVLHVKNMRNLKMASADRVKANKTFQKVLENAKRLKAQSEESSYPLNIEQYTTLQEKRETDAKKYEDMFEDLEGLKISNLKPDLADIETDEAKAARNESFLKSIQKDIYIDEALSIMADIVNN